MSELNDLATSDPAKFKQVTSDIAQKLRDAASSASGGQADFLTKLADKFQQASDSGGVSASKPPAGAGGHHGGHHHVRRYAAQQQQGAEVTAAQGVDPAQLIDSVLQQDGVGGP